ncbi:MAG: hypothetical protein GY947_10730 [Rhodobacteraceae bacterium]|nr:hypothetical protein [Paracoccaceae bacterium]
MNLAATVIFLLAIPTTLLAGPYDGVYRPDQLWAENWDCKSIGMDGGALAIKEGMFHGVENSCELTNPVKIRGMSATLYDAVCQGEGESYSYRLMLLKTEKGVAFVKDGVVSSLVRCQ